MQVFLWADDSESALYAELTRLFPTAGKPSVEANVMRSDFHVLDHQRIPELVFARQWLPNAVRVEQESIKGWAEALLAMLLSQLPADSPWNLHIEPHYGVGSPSPNGRPGMA